MKCDKGIALVKYCTNLIHFLYLKLVSLLLPSVAADVADLLKFSCITSEASGAKSVVVLAGTAVVAGPAVCWTVFGTGHILKNVYLQNFLL